MKEDIVKQKKILRLERWTNFLGRMPGKDAKSAHPPCNRAFALRMMNPSSYSETHISPLDKEIQPVIKKCIAKSVSEEPESLSPASSLTSLQEMSLFSIDEDSFSPHESSRTPATTSKERRLTQNKGKTPAVRQTTPRVAVTPRLNKNLNSVAPRANGTARTGITRSLTSCDGFYNGILRDNSTRSSMPKKRAQKANQQEVLNKSAPSPHALSSSSLRRSKSLRVGNANKDKPPQTNTRSAELRFGRTRSDVKQYSDEFTESDSSTVFSEQDSYHPKNNPRGRFIFAKNTRGMLNSSIDTAFRKSPSNEANSHCVDNFSATLNELCSLITEKHPGEFRIIERLVEMQTAYDERNKAADETISRLKEKVKKLEKCNATNIPSMVVPLMRATSAFQTQLQSIMDSPSAAVETVDVETQVDGGGYTNSSPLQEISCEANAVAAEIEKLCVTTNGF